MYITLCIQKIGAQSGGAERVLVDLANMYARDGHRVEILSYENVGDPPFYPLHPTVIHRNAKPYDDRRKNRAWRSSVTEGTIEHVIQSGIELLDRIPGIARLIWRIRYRDMIERLRQFIDWHKPDVMIAFMPGIFPYLLAARKKAAHKPKIIISNHNLPEADFDSRERWDQNRFDRAFRRQSLGDAEAVTVLLPEYREWFREGERGNIHVIGNVINPPPEVPPAARENVFIAIGRLTKTKDHETLIRAYHAIEAEVPDWIIRIFGVGPLEPDLLQLIEDLGLESRVFVMGRTDRVNVEYARSRVFVLPSRHEGFPLVLGEAYAHGLPAIGFKECSGANVLIENDRNGLLVDGSSDRVGAFAAAMLELATNEKTRERLAEGAREFTRSGLYSADRIFGQWRELLKTVNPHAEAAKPARATKS